MLLQSFLLSLGTSVGMAGTGFATSVLLARLLEPAARGELAALMLAGMLAAGSAQLGLGPAFVYAHRRHRLPPGLRRAGLAAVALAALLIGLAWQQAQFGAGRWSGTPLLVLLALVQALHLHACALAQRHDGLRLFNLLRGLPTLTTAALLAGLALAGRLDPAAAALATTTGFALAVAVALRRDADLPHGSDPDAAQDDPPWRLASHLRYSLHYHLTVLLGMLSTNVDKLWLSWSGQAQALGLYTVAYATSRLIGLVQEAASGALFSRHAGRDEARMNEAVARVFRMTFHPLLLLCALLSLAALALWVPVFGTAYAGARGAFMLLLLECVVGGASWQLAQRFAASGQTGTVAARQILALLPLLALLPWIGRHDPVLELAGATLLSSLLRLALTLGFLRHRAGLRLATLLPRLDDYHPVIDHLRQLRLSRIR